MDTISQTHSLGYHTSKHIDIYYHYSMHNATHIEYNAKKTNAHCRKYVHNTHSMGINLYESTTYRINQL